MDHLHLDHGFHIQQPLGAPTYNPPPQIFGPYAPDGVPLQHLPPDLAASLYPDHGTLLDDSNEAKRRRIARACDMCRKKKIKCDGKLPSCSHCSNYKTECVFTQVEKKRAPPKGAKYIEGLENRVGRMENVLRLSGLIDEDDNGAVDLGTLERKLMSKREQSARESQQPASNPSSPGQAPPGLIDGSASTPRSSLASPEPIKDDPEARTSLTPEKEGEEQVEALSEMMCSLVTDTSGESRYIGSSSSFSIFSPKGIQWVNERTGDNSFQEMISEVSIENNKWTNWKPEVFGDLFPRPVFRPLPTKAETLSLLKDYFENFNCMLPLFHQPTFMHLVERQYSADPYQGTGWWASLNVVLALSHRLRVMSNLVPQDEDGKAWDYLKNAMGCFAELSIRNTDLLSVQALLGMALFMQGTPNPQPTFLLISTAIRLSHSIGLHKRGTGFNLNPIEIEQRKRVFWIAYLMDKDLSLRSGRPPAQDDDDMNVELPDADPSDNIGNIPLSDGKGKMNLFRVMCEFAIIEGKVYKRLYSTMATKQTDGELLNTIGELDRELDDWKDGIPIDFRPEHEIKASHTPLILHVVMLHLAYYNTLTTIHRMSVHRGYWTSRLSNYAIQGLNTRPLNPRVFSSAALCTAAARASISLLKYIPQGDNATVWMLLYFPVSSLVTLFGNILQNPLDPRAKQDTRLMSLVVTFLSMLGEEAQSGGVHRLLGLCSEFERIAKAVIDRAEKEQSSRRKRKSHDPATATAGGNSSSSGSGAARAGSAEGQTPRPSTATSATPKATPTPHSATLPPQQQNAHQPHPQHLQHRHGMDPTRTPLSASMVSPSPMSAAMGGAVAASVASTGHPSPGWPTQADFASNVPPDFAMGGVGQPGPGPHPGAAPGMHVHGSSLAPNFPGGVMLPQEFWTLPMTLDWDWAELSGGAYPSFENGNLGDVGVPHGPP